MSAKADVVVAALRTSAGTQDFTISGFGTPTAYIVVAVGTTSDGTPTDHGRFSFGASDGTRQSVSAVAWDHAVGTTANARRGATDEVLMLLEPTDGSVGAEASHNSFITDGVRLDVTNTATTAWYVMVILFSGVTSYTEYVTHTGAQDATQDFTNSGVTDWDAIFFCSTNDGSGDTADTGRATISLGIGSNEASMVTACTSTLGRSGQATSEALCQHYTSGRVVISPSTSGIFGSLDTLVAITNGFRLTKRDNAANRTFWYFLLKFSGENSKLNSLVDPTSTGNDSQTWCGFQPQILIGLGTLASAWNNTDVAAPWAGSLPHVFAVGANADACMSAVDEDTQATTDNQSAYDSKALRLFYGAGGEDVAATHVPPFDANGYTWNYSNIGDGHMSILAIETQQAAGVAGGAYYQQYYLSQVVG